MTILPSEISKAREAWGESLIGISKKYEQHGIDAARTLADEIWIPHMATILDQSYSNRH